MISRRTQTALTTFHRLLYRVSRGRLGRRLAGMEQVILTTRGRRSGKPRTTMLSGLPHPTRDDVVVLVASDGGRDEHPQWYRNLLADESVLLQRGAETRPMRARRATDDERAALWPHITRIYRGYAAYQSRTAREIPVVLLLPTD